MNQWKMTYPGKPEPYHAASGYAAPSRHTFDKWVWKKDGYILTLTNRTNDSQREGKTKEYWVTRDCNGVERKVIRYRVELDDGKYIRVWEGSSWVELVAAVKDYAEDPEGWLDDRILELLEESSSYGCTVKNLAIDVFDTFYVTSNHTRTVRMRLIWLADHGFVYHAGNVGRGTRWAIVGSEP